MVNLIPKRIYLVLSSLRWMINEHFQFYLTNWNYYVGHKLHHHSLDVASQNDVYIIKREDRFNDKYIFMMPFIPLLAFFIFFN